MSQNKTEAEEVLRCIGDYSTLRLLAIVKEQSREIKSLREKLENQPPKEESDDA